MLWRASRGYTHFISAITFKRSINDISLRWHSFHASVRPSSERVAELTTKEEQNVHTEFTGKISRSLSSRFPIETAVFLSVIEELFFSNASRDEILSRFRTLPSNVLFDAKRTCNFAQEMVHSACPERAVHVLHVAHQIDIVVNHSQYEQVAYQLAMRNHWRYVHIVTAMARRTTGRWTVRLLNWALRSYLETQNYGLLDIILAEFEQHHLKPTQRTYHLLVQGHLRNSNLSRARECLVQMQASGFDMNASTYSTVLSAYRSLGSNNAVEVQAFQALQGIGKRSDTTIVNGLMKMHIDSGNVPGAFRVLRLITLHSPRNDDGGGSGGDGQKGGSLPNSTFSSSSPSVLPDNATFNILLAFLAQRKEELPNVLRVCRQMRSVGLHADAETAAAVVLAYSTANMIDRALAIVYEMCKRHSIPVDRKLFGLLGCLDDMVEDDLHQVFSVRPTTDVFNALLRAILPSKGIVGMRRILRGMRQASILPDASTTQIILSYLHDVQHMRPRSLIHILRRLSTFPTDQASLTLKHLNAILRSVLRRELDIINPGSWNASAQRVRFGHVPRFSIQRLCRLASRFDPTAGISVASFGGRISKLFEPIVKTLAERQVMSDRMTFALRIRRDAVVKLDIESALRIFDVMTARGIRANAYHYSALIEGYAETGNMKGAREIMTRASHAGIEPSVVMYTILIKGYGRLGKPELAMSTFREMVAAGVKPDSAAVDAVVGAYWFVRAYKTARELLLDLWPLVAPFPSELNGAPLRVLLQFLRNSRGDSKKVVRPLESLRERRRRKLLRRKMSRTLSELERWREVVEAVSWAKADIGLGYMFHADASSTGRAPDWF